MEISLKNLKVELQKHRKNHVLVDDKKKWISGHLEEYIKDAKINTILPLFHKNQFLGLLCIGKKFMDQSFTRSDFKILEIISNHLTKALYNYQLIDEDNWLSTVRICMEHESRNYNYSFYCIDFIFIINIISSLESIKN